MLTAFRKCCAELGTKFYQEFPLKMGIRRESEGKQPWPRANMSSLRTLPDFISYSLAFLHLLHWNPPFPCFPSAKCSSTGLPPLLSEPRGWEWVEGGMPWLHCVPLFALRLFWPRLPMRKLFAPPSPLSFSAQSVSILANLSGKSQS